MSTSTHTDVLVDFVDGLADVDDAVIHEGVDCEKNRVLSVHLALYEVKHRLAQVDAIVDGVVFADAPVNVDVGALPAEGPLRIDERDEPVDAGLEDLEKTG